MAKAFKSITIDWSSSLAYAVGLIASDGCLSSDGRHIEFNSKDKEQVENLKKCLGLNNKITKKARGGEKTKKYYRIQFGDVRFYKFLLSIGLKPRKSLVLAGLNIPPKFFPDFLRGHFDGDGNLDIESHPESRFPQIRFRIASGSRKFLKWLHSSIKKELPLRGYMTQTRKADYLNFGKEDTLKILPYIYYSADVTRLSRKFEKAVECMRA